MNNGIPVTVEEVVDMVTKQESAQTMAVEVAKPPPDTKTPITAAQAKVEAIAELTHSAYAKAATLNLTKAETDALLADFPDEAFKPGAAGKENLIYIEHAFLRDRFTQVFGMGQWAIVPRRTWNEEFTIPGYGNKPDTQGCRVYVEAMLVVRGCFVAESVGAMEYYPKNQSQNYGDAVEGAKTAAFRRCCKEFGVGLQAWKKDWCQGWWDRKKVPGRPAATRPPQQPTQPPKTPPAQSQGAKKAIPAPTEESRAKMLEVLKAGVDGERRGTVVEYFFKVGQLLPTEPLETMPLRFVPGTQKQMEALVSCIENFESGGEAIRAFEPHLEPGTKAAGKPIEVPRGEDSTGEEDEAWRQFPMPFGKKAGVKMEDLEKNYLFGLWANYKVETEYNGKPKKPETIKKDQMLRAMLDAAGAHYGFQKKD